MKLIELLHSIDNETKSGLVNLDDWRWTDAEHLVSMGFVFQDEYHLQTEKPPKITIYKKKEKDPETGKIKAFFFIEEPKKKTKRFKTFNDVVDFFDNYAQPELDKNM